MCQALTDQCNSSPCQNGGSCINSLNTFTCKCVNGFSGTLCQMVNAPSNNATAAPAAVLVNPIKSPSINAGAQGREVVESKKKQLVDLCPDGSLPFIIYLHSVLYLRRK